ncbi:unnamed protein product [Calypogeia fissa]
MTTLNKELIVHVTIFGLGISCAFTPFTTVTGRKWGAGTDSTMRLRLYNNASHSAYFPSLDNGNNNFKKGKVEKFLKIGNCVDHIFKMALYTVNSGIMPSWFVESFGVSVATPSAAVETTKWLLNVWLPRDDSTVAVVDLRDNCVRVEPCMLTGRESCTPFHK